MAGSFTTPVAESTPFEPERNPDSTGQQSNIVSENVQEAIEEAYWAAPGSIARFTIPLLHKGTVGNGTFLGYSESITGDDTPIILPRKCQITEFTFSNNRTSADYTLELRKNSTTAPVFFTVSKVNTKLFSEQGLSEEFLPGDQIFVKYLDNGTNARNVAMILFFKNIV